MKAVIQRAGMCDLSDWMALVRRVRDNFPGLETEEALREYQETVQRNMARGSALCARLNDVLCGVLLYSVKHGCLSCMAVAPEYRRQGVGSAMVTEMLKCMKETEVWVDTFREGDPLGIAPRALYQKHGFVPGELLMDNDYPVQRFYRRKGGKCDE